MFSDFLTTSRNHKAGAFILNLIEFVERPGISEFFCADFMKSVMMLLDEMFF